MSERGEKLECGRSRDERQANGTNQAGTNLARCSKVRVERFANRDQVVSRGAPLCSWIAPRPSSPRTGAARPRRGTVPPKLPGPILVRGVFRRTIGPTLRLLSWRLREGTRTSSSSCETLRTLSGRRRRRRGSSRTRRSPWSSGSEPTRRGGTGVRSPCGQRARATRKWRTQRVGARAMASQDSEGDEPRVGYSS